MIKTRVDESFNKGDQDFGLVVVEIPGVVVTRSQLWILRCVDIGQVNLGRLRKKSDGGFLFEDCEQGVGSHDSERSRS